MDFVLVLCFGLLSYTSHHRDIRAHAPDSLRLPHACPLFFLRPCVEEQYLRWAVALASNCVQLAPWHAQVLSGLSGFGLIKVWVDDGRWVPFEARAGLNNGDK